MSGYYQTDLEVIAAFLHGVVKPHLRDTEFSIIMDCFSKIRGEHDAIEAKLDPAFLFARFMYRGALVLSKDADMPVQKTTPPPPVIDTVRDRNRNYTCVALHDPDQPWMK